MGKRKISNLLGLAVLSLLTERPMHPYEMFSVMRARGVSMVIKLNQSSLYSVIEALQREELIRPVETQREGRYPERTLYATTETGKTELVNWLHSLIRQPEPEYSSFAAGLTFMGQLAPAEVATLLTEHARHLRVQINDVSVAIEKALQLGVDPLFVVEDKYLLAILTAKVTFIQQLLEDLANNTLTEIQGDRQIWKIHRSDLALLGSEYDESKADET